VLLVDDRLGATITRYAPRFSSSCRADEPSPL